MALKDQLLSFGVKKLLAYKARPGEIERVLNDRTEPRANLPTNARVVAAAVQMEFNLVDDGAQYAKKIYRLAREAVLRDAQLVAFPEYAWTPLLGMLPGIRGLAAKSGGGLEGAVGEIGRGATLADIFRTIAPAASTAFLATMRGVARALGIYLMSGSTIECDAAGRLYNVAYLFGPDGTQIGRQPKLHPYESERDWLTVGDSLQTYALPFAKVSLPVCMDLTFWETTRLAWSDGAELVFDPKADGCGDKEFCAARGIHTRVQEAPVFGIAPKIVTDLFGLHWRGPSEIVAPLGLDPRGSILAQADRADREEVILAELDLAHLREYRAARVPEFNGALLAKHLPHAYAEYRERVKREGKRSVK